MLHPNVNAYAIGWGSRAYGESSSDILLHVRLVIREAQDCIDVDPNSFNQAIELCAGGDEYQDTCRGDSGGGLYAFDKKARQYLLIGITSNG